MSELTKRATKDDPREAGFYLLEMENSKADQIKQRVNEVSSSYDVPDHYGWRFFSEKTPLEKTIAEDALSEIDDNYTAPQYKNRFYIGNSSDIGSAVGTLGGGLAGYKASDGHVGHTIGGALAGSALGTGADIALSHEKAPSTQYLEDQGRFVDDSGVTFDTLRPEHFGAAGGAIAGGMAGYALGKTENDENDRRQQAVPAGALAGGALGHLTMRGLTEANKYRIKSQQ